MQSNTTSAPAVDRFERIFAEYIAWKTTFEVEHADRVAALLSVMKSAGADGFDDYISEAMGDFLNRMTSLCVPQYGDGWIKGYHRVSDWVAQHAVRNDGDRLLAIFSSSGVDRVDAIIRSLAAESAPKRPSFAPKP